MITDDQPLGSVVASTADADGTRLHYESCGRGPAVLLVMGFGMTSRQWWRTVPVLARHFRVLTFDNRGMGASDPSPWPYFAARMADDAIAVLDSAGEARAHVYGLSLGGMVAQEIALRHPDRIGSLVLGATTAGGRSFVHRDDTAPLFLSRSALLSTKEANWASVPYLYGTRTRSRHGQRIADDLAHRIGESGSRVAQAQQLLAAVTHDTSGRLEKIAAPTLVVHGGDDKIVDVDNGRRLAEQIPDAEFKLWENAGHFYITDEPRADEQIVRFLLRHTPQISPAARLAGRAASRLRSLRPR